MRILILNTDYPSFLVGFYAGGDLFKQPYAHQIAKRNESLFGVYDIFSYYLRAAGHEAWEVHVNNQAMQKTWAREHGFDFGSPRPPSLQGPAAQLLRRLPKGAVLARGLRNRVDSRWFLPILKRQIEHYQPDVILNQDMYTIPSGFLASFKPAVKLVAGQIASPVPEGQDWNGYDLILSSLPNLVDWFSGQGLRTAYMPLGFDPRVLERVPLGLRTIPLLFVGSFSKHHRTRIELVERLCRETQIEIWASGLDALTKDSPIHARCKGQAWGIAMYEKLAQAQIVLNQHIDMADDYANNCRLFEVTGMGAMLLTDRKRNLGDFFSEGSECSAYSDADECLKTIQYYLADDSARTRIASAGQARTLNEHAYVRRVDDLIKLLDSLMP